MISAVKGIILSAHKDALVILTSGGVGYEIKVHRSRFPDAPGEELILYTYLKVSDQALDLYGFRTLDEREFFELLMTVSGIGPKSAMHILAAGSIDDIKRAIVRKDAQYLSAVQGIGKKTAERLVVELQAKIGLHDSADETGEGGTIVAEVIDALVGMGYGRDEAKAVVVQLDSQEKNTTELLRLALRHMK